MELLRTSSGIRKMKIGLSALLAVVIAGIGFAQASAHAATLPAKPHVDNAVTHVTFWVDHKKVDHRKRGHAHRGHDKHRVAHAQKHLKKKH
jgi:hypothetical protein